MRSYVVAFLAGLLFAVGLALSGMTLPTKVIGFLDVFGDWDPSLALVMVGAIGVHATARRLLAGRARPLLGGEFEVPGRTRVDRELLTGAALFGLGWGLVGICPGPALVSLVTLQAPLLVFFAAMAAGMLLFRDRR